MAMSRKQFIESHGASCKNWTWSWSFVNEEQKFVIFGQWSPDADGRQKPIMSEKWKSKANTSGANQTSRISPGYTQALEHLALIEQGYQLKTFPIERGATDEGTPRIKSFTPQLTDRELRKQGADWYADNLPIAHDQPLAEEVPHPERYVEGALATIAINRYERSGEARIKCLEAKGYQCTVCEFDFEKAYGEAGKGYIHVHHLMPLSEIKQTYQVDPARDLIPVCPNCHAMLHRGNGMTVSALREAFTKNSTQRKTSL